MRNKQALTPSKEVMEEVEQELGPILTPELQADADARGLEIANKLDMSYDWYYRTSRVLGISINQVAKRLMNQDKPKKKRVYKPKRNK